MRILGKIFWFSLSAVCFYLVYVMINIAIEVDPTIGAVVNKIQTAIEEDIGSVTNTISDKVGIDVAPEKAVRVKYPRYDWQEHKDTVDYGLKYISPDSWSTIKRADGLDCVSNIDYYYEQYASISKVMVYERLPRDDALATDEQIQSAIDWMKVEMAKLVQPLTYCE